MDAQIGVALLVLIGIIVGLAQYVQSMISSNGNTREELVKDVEREVRLRLIAESKASRWEHKARQYYIIATNLKERTQRKTQILHHIQEKLGVIEEKHNINLTNIVTTAIELYPEPIPDIDTSKNKK